MTSKKESKDLAVTEDASIIPVTGNVPAWVPVGEVATGAEHFTSDDARIPRLALAQGLSHQMIPQDPLYIEDLKLGDAFNDLTGEVYGHDPLTVIFVRADKPRWVEFGDDRSIVDPNVPVGDARTQFTTDPETKERIPPRATMFYDYVLLLQVDDRLEPLAFSLSKTGIKHTAKRLNGLLRSRPIPIYAIKYSLTPNMQKNDEGSWYLFSVKQLGYVDEATYKQADKFFNIFKDKTIEFDRNPGEDDEPLPGNM